VNRFSSQGWVKRKDGKKELRGGLEGRERKPLSIGSDTPTPTPSPLSHFSLNQFLLSPSHSNQTLPARTYSQAIYRDEEGSY